jgi:phospholipase A2
MYRLLLSLIIPCCIPYTSLLASDQSNQSCTDHYHHTQATIRINSTLSTDEQQWLATRTPHIKEALEEMLQMSLADDEIPRIAFCFSGGGYRAMLATIGTLQGACTPPRIRSSASYLAHHIASWLYHKPAPLPLQLPTHTPHTTAPTLFDIASYCATLSGSTWAVSGWLYSHMSLDAYCARLATNIQKSIVEDIDFTAVSKALAKKHAHNQSVSLVDVYASLLAQKLLKGFGNNPYDTLLTDQQTYASTGSIPFPVYSTIIGESAPNYQWVEYTPYEVGSTYLKAFVPTWAFGRQFDKGISCDYSPQQPLAFFLGIWGSAMCVTAEEFFDLVKPHIENEIITIENDEHALLNTIESDVASLVHGHTSTQGSPDTKVSKNILTTVRLSPACVYNWTFNCPEVNMHKHSTFTLVDAGIDFRIPTPPLLRAERHVDIIIIMDASDRPLGTELHLAQAYAQQHKLPFPEINYHSTTKPFSVHGVGNTNNTPIIIYMPLVQNQKYHNGWDPRTAAFTSTYNFKYTKEQTYLLTGLTRYTMIEHHADILGVIKEWINTKRKRTTNG